jgi:hypothetical protein
VAEDAVSMLSKLWIQNLILKTELLTDKSLPEVDVEEVLVSDSCQLDDYLVAQVLRKCPDVVSVELVPAVSKPSASDYQPQQRLNIAAWQTNGHSNHTLFHEQHSSGWFWQ